MVDTPAALSSAREQFLELVADVRPELHRYCARLTGSVVDGEDIVQEALAKAFYALSLLVEVPPLRPWLFRIAHNAALDYLKSHGRKLTEPVADVEELANVDSRPDPAVVRAALAQFLTLPLAQRSAVILKDVLGHSLEETAETMGATVMAVKAALVRGRAKLLQAQTEAPSPTAATRAEFERYATLFNARDWDGVRALVSDDCRLDLVSRSHRRGQQVRLYFERYAEDDVRLELAELEGQLVLAVRRQHATEPGYFILLGFEDGQVAAIRDFRYVPYITRDAELRPVT